MGSGVVLYTCDNFIRNMKTLPLLSRRDSSATAVLPLLVISDCGGHLHELRELTPLGGVPHLSSEHIVEVELSQLEDTFNLLQEVVQQVSFKTPLLPPSLLYSPPHTALPTDGSQDGGIHAPRG